MGDTFDELPEDWTEFADEGSGSSYYYNSRTKRNTWTRPEAERVAAEMAVAAGGGAGMRSAIRRASQACASRRASTTQMRGAKSTMAALGRKKKGKKKKKKKKKKSGERGIVTEACSDLSKHKKFGQMLNYSLTTLIGNIEPGHSGWEDNLAQFLQEGGLDTLDDIIAIHSAKGNGEVVELAERLRAIVEENKRAVLRALRLKRSKPCLRLVAAMVVAQPIEAVDLVLNAGEGTIGAVLSMLNESGHDIEVANPALAFLDQIAKDSEGLFVLKNADGFEAVLGWILKNYDAILADIDNPDVEDSFGIAAANGIAILAQLAGDDEGLAKKLSEVAELRSLIDTVMDYRSNAIPPLIASCLELLTKMPGGYVDMDLLRKILDLIERNGGALGSLCADPRLARAFCMLTAALQGPKYGMDPNSEELRSCRKIIEGLKGVHDDLEDLCEMLADPESAMLDELDNMCAILRQGDVNGGDVLESFEKMKEISRLVPGAAPEASTAQLELLLTSFADYQSMDEIAVPILRTLMLLATNPKNIDALASLNGIEQLIRALRENPANLRLLQILIQLLEKFVFHDVFKRRVGELGGCEALVLCLRRNCEPDLAQSEVALPPPGPPGRARPVSEAIVSVKGDLKDHDILMVALLSLLANMCYNCPENIAHIIARGRSTGTDLETDGIEAVGHTIETFMNKAQIVRAAAGCLANCMTGDDAGVKEKCGERCGTILVQALTAMPDNVSMFQQCVRAFGNMSQSDDNIRLLCQARCVSAMVAAMTYCLEDEGTDAKASSTCLSSAITVLGWFAEASEDVGPLERYDTDHTVAAAIFKQGGAHAMLRAGQTARDGDSGLILSVLRSLNIVCDDAKTAKKLMKEGLLDLLNEALTEHGADDPDICENSIELLMTLNGAGSLPSSSMGPYVSHIMKAMHTHGEESDTLLPTAQAVFSQLAMTADIAKQIYQSGALSLTLRLLEERAEKGATEDADAFVTQAFETLIRMGKHTEAGLTIALAKHAVGTALKVMEARFDDAALLLLGLKLISILTFDPRAVPVLTKANALQVVMRVVGRHPRNEELMVQCIKAIDFIGNGEAQYARYVKKAGGEQIIKRIMKAYATSSAIQTAGTRALVSLKGV